MMFTFDPTLALTVLTHPFQVALMVVTFGALVRQGVCAVVRHQADSIVDTHVAVTNVRAAA